MNKKILSAGILGGVIIFIWSAVSWMMLPYHMSSIHNFTNVNAVVDVVKQNAPKNGVYLMPTMHQNGAAPSQEEMTQPMVFAVVHLEGMRPSMNQAMAISLATQIIAAFLVAYLLMKTSGLGYFGRVGFVVVFALAAGVVTDVPYWNWFGFDCYYTLVQLADLLVGWFLAGLVMAAICRKQV